MAGRAKAHGVRGAWRRGRLLVVMVALVVVTVLGLAMMPAASADPAGLLVHVAGDPAGWTRSPSRPLLNVSNLVPGDSAAGSLQIRNASSSPAALAVAATDVHDDKRCVAAAPTGVGSCGPAMGQLRHWLLFTIRRSDTGVVVWSGHIDELASAVTVVSAMPAGSEVGLEMSAALPMAAANTVEEDVLGYGLRWTLTENVGSPQARLVGETVLQSGPSATPGSSTVLGGRLAFTGWPLVPTILLAGGLLALGGLVTLTARERRHRRIP